MTVHKSGNIDTSGGLSAELSAWRPQTRREWIHWYAMKHAGRVALTRRGQTDLIEAYGFDADTIADQVRRWGGPDLPGHLFAAWFGTCTRPVAAPSSRIRITSPPQPAGPAPKPRRPVGDRDTGVDEVLVDRGIAGGVPLSRLNAEERIAAVGELFMQGEGLGTISKRLHVNGEDAAKLIAAWRERRDGAAA